ncbi:MAG TPA: carboxypeptidase-like regulatory domain-containing protein [Thermoanaerobaculia bacterium]|nr:carboxypeptidase-like regulatory domain-containing protein [Thermoanaerobaculia bacterium]
MTFRSVGILILSALTLACGGDGGSSPTDPPTTAILRGLVHTEPTGPPISGVEVRVQGRSAQTAADGTFRFEGLTPGMANTVLTKEGFEPLTAVLTLNSGDNFYSLGMRAIP